MSEYGSEGSDEELGSTPSPPQARDPPKAPQRVKKETKSAQASPIKVSKPEAQPGEAGEDFLGMREYMKQMDRELATTTIGESFEKKPVAPEKVGTSHPSCNPFTSCFTCCRSNQ